MTSIIKTSRLYSNGMNEPGYSKPDWSVISLVFVWVRILAVKWRSSIQISLNKQTNEKQRIKGSCNWRVQRQTDFRYGCIQVLTKCRLNPVSLHFLSLMFFGTGFKWSQAEVWAYLLPAESYWWKGGFPTPPFYFILEQPFDWVSFEQLFSCAPPWTSCSG